MNIKQLERLLNDQLEDKSFEELLEEFDLTTLEVFQGLYEAGMLDEDLLDAMVPSDY